jgi:signal transduction histidine kinase
VIMRELPLPIRFLLLVAVVVVAPLTLAGFWIAGSAARSGEALLRSRLRETNASVAAEISANWLRPRSGLLSFGEDDMVQQELERRALESTDGARSAPPPQLTARFESLPATVVEGTLLDMSGAEVWHFSRGPTALPTFSTELPVHARLGARLLGTFRVRVLGDAVLGTGGLSSAAGAVVAVIDAEEGASLRTLPFDPVALSERSFEWDGATWINERRSLLEPRLDVISASPIAEFTAPFESAARRGLLVLVAVTLLATMVAGLLTRRMTRSLSRLAAAADHLSRGELAVRVPDSGGNEVGRVSQAFNRMAESLERTLAELSQREALAAVGSFASELAHEVRNPLTSIKVDLQYVEEQLPQGSEARAVQRSALDEISRLDRTVAGVLQIARSGRITLQPLDLRGPLRAAIRVVEPLASEAGATLSTEIEDSAIPVLGDQGALQQLFTNLLLNAVQGVDPGGRIGVVAQADRHDARVHVRDNGRGIPSEHLAKVRDPFFSTRADGTGLGLAIADRIAAAHQAEIEIESEPGKGTDISVRFRAATV